MSLRVLVLLMEKLFKSILKKFFGKRFKVKISVTEIKEKSIVTKKNPKSKFKKPQYNETNLLKVFDRLSDNQRDMIVSQMQKQTKYQFRTMQHMIKKRVTVITNKLAKGKPLTKVQKEFIDKYSDFFIKSKEQRKIKVASSWIIDATYIKKSQTLKLNMKRGRMNYPFYNVPIWVWIALTRIKSNAGTYWWKNNIGLRYSSNPHNWIKRRK